MLAIADVELSLAFMQPLTPQPLLLRELMGGRTLRLFHLVLGELTVKKTDGVNKVFEVTVTNLWEFDLTAAQSVTLDSFYYHNTTTTTKSTTVGCKTWSFLSPFFLSLSSFFFFSFSFPFSFFFLLLFFFPSFLLSFSVLSFFFLFLPFLSLLSSFHSFFFPYNMAALHPKAVSSVSVS